MTVETMTRLAAVRAAHDALEAAIIAMGALQGSDRDSGLEHDMTTAYDNLHWSIEEMLADAGDKAAMRRLQNAAEQGYRN